MARSPSRIESSAAASLHRKGSNRQLVADAEHDNLVAWLNAYLAVNVDASSTTFRAKQADIQRFVRFFEDKTGGHHCDSWTPSITKAYLKWLPKQKARDRRGNPTDRCLAASTCARNVDTMRTAARWIHRQRPFLTDLPFTKKDYIEQDEPDWQGLTELEMTRLVSASEQLIKLQTRSDQFPRRNHAQLLLLRGLGLRVEEMNSLDFAQFQGKHLVNIVRSKTNKITPRLFLDKPIREALNEFIKHERGTELGPLFPSKNGKRLAQSNVYGAFKRIAAHANSSLSDDQHIKIHPHLLRHTALRKLAKGKKTEQDIRAVRRVSGLKSDKYLWRYIKASDEEVEEALADAWE